MAKKQATLFNAVAELGTLVRKLKANDRSSIRAVKRQYLIVEEATRRTTTTVGKLAARTGFQCSGPDSGRSPFD